ncbi:MAG: TonB-dependent receptor plug domain-containing protein, partial [Aquincola tertiaricarbonis]
MTDLPLHRSPAARRTACALGLACALGATAQPAAPADEPTTDDLAAVLAQPVYGSSRLGAASKRDEDLATAPGAAMVRTGGEILAQGYRTLGEVLESMPGVHLRYDRAYSYVGLRGITRPGDYTSRLLVLVDGVRANDALYESASMDREFPIDVSLIDRVEFIPGPGSALYGSNAVAGVVNVITRSPAQLAGAQAGLAVGSERQRRLTASWGGTLGAGRLLLGAATEHRAGGTLHYAEYATEDNPRGRVQGQDGERADKLFAKLQQGGLSLSLAVSQRRKELPTGAYDATFGTPAPWTDSYVTLGAAYTRSLGPEAALDVLLNHSRYGFDSTALYGDDGDFYSRNRNDARWLGGELRWRWSGLAGHRITLGVEGQRNYRQRIDLDNLEAGEPSAATFSGTAHRVGLYANDEWTLRPGLQLTLGLRTDRRTDGSNGLSPRLGASWAATPAWTFKWLTGQAYREPNFSELYYEDEVQRRPQALRVEALRSNELVVLWRPAEAWQWQAAVHRT